MKLSQKKTCNGCRAIAGGICDLGKEIEKVYFAPSVVMGYGPLEPCYKPLTYGDWFSLRDKPLQRKQQ